VDGDRCERVLEEQEVVRLAERAKALADATRLRLAAFLATFDELSVCDLPWVAGPTEDLIAPHLRALRSAGLVTSRRDGKMVLYRLTKLGRGLVATVLEPEEATA
jgi:ArsR family transcriptional regulator, lead/cadmium/zinc/bismuth-responsive transcriptional repressor